MKCKECGFFRTKNNSRSIPIVETIPHLTEKVVGKYCQKCNNFTFKMSDAWFLKSKFKKWVIFEHTGHHVKKKYPKKDHYKHHRSMSMSLLGEAPKGIYSNRSIKKCRATNKSQELTLYLFKGPKVKNHYSHGFRETISEIILNHLAQKITKTASASIGNHKGELIFITQIFTKQNEQLIHCTEIFKELYDDDGISEIQQNRNAQRKFYSIQHVEDALKEFSSSDYSLVVQGFYKMLFVDAWLGNQDRHAENWGLKKVINCDGNVIYEFSPLFDTARGIFWNESITTLYRKYFKVKNDKNLNKYIENSRPLMSLENVENANHFDIAGYVKSKDRALFNNLLNLLNSIDIIGAISLYNGSLHPKRLKLISKLLEKRRNFLNKV